MRQNHPMKRPRSFPVGIGPAPLSLVLIAITGLTGQLMISTHLSQRHTHFTYKGINDEMLRLDLIVGASGRRLLSSGRIPRRSAFRRGHVDERPPLGYLVKNHPDDKLPPD